MLRVALAGTYNSIISYAELIRNIPGCILCGIHTRTHNTIDHPAFISDKIEDLLDISDAMIICEPSFIDFKLIKASLKRSKHVFLYSDYSISHENADFLQKIAEEAGVFLYLRHKMIPAEIEQIITKFTNDPEYIDIYRNLNNYSEKRPQKLYEVLYKELLYIFSLSRHNYRRSYIHTVPYSSFLPTMVNIRVIFTNGTSANLTINNFSDNDTRLIRIFQGNKMLQLDSVNARGKYICQKSQVKHLFKFKDETLINSNFSDEIRSFLNVLVSAKNHTTHLNNGIIFHKTASQIIDRIIPYPVEK